jgi:multimeric flavodoxin WrbA
MVKVNDLIANSPEKSYKVLFLYYSFSGQTGVLVNRMAAGLKEQGVEVFFEKIKPVKHLRFPTSGFMETCVMMLATFLQQRVPIKELSARCRQDFDLIILSGPTWSYNPSGPILAFLDRDGREILEDRDVVAMISCRGYWRTHWQRLRKRLNQCGANIVNLIAFSHPNPEPWRTIGVFLTIAGKNPEGSGFFGKHYTRFGHTTDQMEEAHRFGKLLGDAIRLKTPIYKIDFQTRLALP